MLCYIQHTKAPANIDELIKVVEESYWEQGLEKGQNIFLSHQKVMESVMLANGGNKYPLPHMKKSTIRRNSVEIPTTIDCSEEAVQAALEVIADV